MSASLGPRHWSLDGKGGIDFGERDIPACDDDGGAGKGTEI
jgi:hypothetical protein